MTRCAVCGRETQINNNHVCQECMKKEGHVIRIRKDWNKCLHFSVIKAS